MTRKLLKLVTLKFQKTLTLIAGISPTPTVKSIKQKITERENGKKIVELRNTEITELENDKKTVEGSNTKMQKNRGLKSRNNSNAQTVKYIRQKITELKKDKKTVKVSNTEMLKKVNFNSRNNFNAHCQIH